MKAFHKMIGHPWTYRTEPYYILDVEEVEAGMYKVKTDKGDLRVSKFVLSNHFLPIGAPMGQALSKPFDIAKVKEMVDAEMKPVSGLATILMENIKTLKTDKNFIPQAKAMNEQAKTVLLWAKIKLDAIRILKQ